MSEVKDIETINGRVQVSGHPGDAHIGLLVERESLFGGTLMTAAQARELADMLLNCVGKEHYW